MTMRHERLTPLLQTAWRRRGALATALRPLAAVYLGVINVRRALYRHGWLKTLHLPVPVVVVGNLITGGAGKTPTVMAVVALLRRAGWHPGIVSRGHGRRGRLPCEVQPGSSAGEVGDEPLMMARRTSAPVCVGRDRVAAGRLLLAGHPDVDVVVADDGLQHLRLGRTAQVLVFDERGVGNGWLLPAGPLRERLPGHLPPRSFVLYNAEASTTPLPGAVVHRSLGGVAALADWWARGTVVAPLSHLQGRPLLAAAGVAHPERFFDMLRSHGLTFTPLPLTDHFDYAALPWPLDTADVVTTEKDAIKLDPLRLGATRVWVATLDFALPPEIEVALLTSIGQPPARRRRSSGPHDGNATP